MNTSQVATLQLSNKLSSLGIIQRSLLPVQEGISEYGVLKIKENF